MSIIATRPRRIKGKPARAPRVNPRASWPAWTDELAYAIPEPPASEIDLSDDSGESSRPTPAAEAYLAGWDRGYSLDLGAVPPSDMPGAARLSWWWGRNRAVLQREADDAEIDRMGSDRAEPYEIRDEDIYRLGAVS